MHLFAGAFAKTAGSGRRVLPDRIRATKSGMRAPRVPLVCPPQAATNATVNSAVQDVIANKVLSVTGTNRP